MEEIPEYRTIADTDMRQGQRRTFGELSIEVKYVESSHATLALTLPYNLVSWIGILIVIAIILLVFRFYGSKFLEKASTIVSFFKPRSEAEDLFEVEIRTPQGEVLHPDHGEALLRPDKVVQTGEMLTTSVDFGGRLTKGFFNQRVIFSDGSHCWKWDPSTLKDPVDMNKGGILEGQVDTQHFEWDWKLDKDGHSAPPGRCVVQVIAMSDLVNHRGRIYEYVQSITFLVLPQSPQLCPKCLEEGHNQRILKIYRRTPGIIVTEYSCRQKQTVSYDLERELILISLI